MELKAHTIAPCPYDAPCPLAHAFKEGKDWCHFSVRIPRGKYHRRAKDGTLPYEDEKSSYLVVSPHGGSLLLSTHHKSQKSLELIMLIRKGLS